MKRIAATVTVVSLAILGIAASSQSELVDRVAAVVNGEVITLSMVEDTMSAIWTDPPILPKSQQDALQKLIDHKLKLQEARKLGVIVSEESLAVEIANVASRFASSKEFSEALRRRDTTREELEENLVEQIMVREMVNRKFQLFIEVTEVEAAVFFEQHKQRFVMPKTARSNRIFFRLASKADKTVKEAVRRRAETVLKELKSSSDAQTRKAGAVDYILTETPIGYFITKLTDGSQMQQEQVSFGEVKEEIKASLSQQKTDDELEAWLKEQRKLADIRVKVEFKDQ